MSYDYGHEKFLNSLTVQKATVVKALERLERRTAEVMYEDQKWFKWVRECQDEEEQNREKEQKKVKLEAAMFKRNLTMTEARTKERRNREDKRRQNVFLEKIYKERMKQRAETDTEDSDWDPIEDFLEDNRGNFIGTVK